MTNDDYESEQLRLKLKYIEHLNTQLSSRLNYFLIGIAFLVSAFVTLITANNFGYSAYLICLALLVCSSAYTLALFFTLMNFTDSNRYKGFAESVKEPGFCYLQWQKWIWDCPKELQKTGYNVPYVSLIPLGFSIFWLFITIGLNFYIRCNSHWRFLTCLSEVDGIIILLVTIGVGCFCWLLNKHYNFRCGIVTFILAVLIIFMICLPCSCLLGIIYQ